MAQREEGWPLGLQPLNARVGMGRNSEFSGSNFFNTLVSASSTSSTDSSSDLGSESTGSTFHERSITLGSLIGVSSVIELSRRSLRRNKTQVLNSKKSDSRSKTWCFSLCSRDSTDSENVKSAPSLGHFLAVERKAANDHRGNRSFTMYGPDEYVPSEGVAEPNSLFLDGKIAPPPSSLLGNSDANRRENRGLEQSYGLQCCFCARHTE